MQEQGMADFEVSAWYGVAAPAGLPAAVSERLQTALRQAVADAEVAAAMARVGADVGFLDASATERFWAADTAQWKRVAAFANISID
jgi:tripartite-type tricarboxylate transporter receptor subunit TctC